MLNLPFIMGFIGAAVGIIIGILIYSQIATAIPCPGYNSTSKTYDKTAQGYNECNNAKGYAWTVIGILPVGLFFALFGLFGGLGGRE